MPCTKMLSLLDQQGGLGQLLLARACDKQSICASRGVMAAEPGDCYMAQSPANAQLNVVEKAGRYLEADGSLAMNKRALGGWEQASVAAKWQSLRSDSDRRFYFPWRTRRWMDVYIPTYLRYLSYLGKERRRGKGASLGGARRWRRPLSFPTRVLHTVEGSCPYFTLLNGVNVARSLGQGCQC
jgi:hypothetical protein